MMEMRINGGSFKITDDNESIVSGNIADEINEAYQQPDQVKDSTLKNKPKLTILQD